MGDEKVAAGPSVTLARFLFHRMQLPLFIAFRHLKSRRYRGFISFITLFAVLGVTLGVAALIITLSILDGFENTIKSNLVGFSSHLQLFSFQDQPLPDADRTVAFVRERFPDVVQIAPYVAREAMVRSEADIEGVLVKGIDPAVDFSGARFRVVEGSFNLDEREEGAERIVIGKRLAEKLEVSVGDRVLVLALSGPALSISRARLMQFEVEGVYETGMAEYDETYVYTHLRNAQRLFQMGSGVSGFDVLVRDVSQLPVLASQLPVSLGYPYYARTMYQTHRNLFTWIELQKKPIPIILALIIIVATVNIVGTLLMMVMEKTNEIGTLRALGAERRMIASVFRLQGMFIGVGGTILGNAAAYGLCWLELRFRFISLPSDIYYMTHVPIELNAFNFIVVSAVALVLCYAASLVPSRIAAGLDPIRTLRFA